MIKQKKDGYFAQLTKDIEDGKNICWKKFNQLKKQRTPVDSKLDIFDMRNFVNFFKELYGRKALSSARINELEAEMSTCTSNSRHTGNEAELEATLNDPITLEELISALKGLKKGKAVSEDLIANEFLKQHLQLAVLNLFNECMRLGVYPWNTALVTPLHKKGNLYDPNNYRAIAIGSNLGKLFSSILLNRLTQFRAEACPDPPNQLGFCKNAQTSDHILSLTTCIDKYVNHEKKRLYGCFVDYKKAFDSVCREALLYKLWQL